MDANGAAIGTAILTVSGHNPAWKSIGVRFDSASSPSSASFWPDYGWKWPDFARQCREPTALANRFLAGADQKSTRDIRPLGPTADRFSAPAGIWPDCGRKWPNFACQRRGPATLASRFSVDVGYNPAGNRSGYSRMPRPIIPRPVPTKNTPLSTILRSIADRIAAGDDGQAERGC